MKLKYEMTTMEMDGEIMGIPVGSDVEFSGILRMNETTEFILDQLKEDTTVDKIVEAMAAVYDADTDKLRAGAESIIKVLEEEGLLA